jgi:hypothetical protein
MFVISIKLAVTLGGGNHLALLRYRCGLVVLNMFLSRHRYKDTVIVFNEIQGLPIGTQLTCLEKVKGVFLLVHA